MAVNRQIPALEAGEREMLVSWLEFQRDTLAVKCEGLTDEQLREECADARARVAAAPSLDCTGTQNGKEYSLRWIMIHMIEEYARHLGHADLLRERIDGRTGQ
jgi:hypothetical protein